MYDSLNYSKSQLYLLTALRVVIGWHFLYEGLVKLANPDWSSIGFLLDSQGAFSNLFYSLASNPDVLKVVDTLNIAGLTIIGLGLILGSFTRLATIGGIVLLAFYYLSHPPFIGLKYVLPMEGSYLVVNKNLIELVALCVLLVFPTGHMLGFDRLNYLLRKRKSGRD
ncbi:MAG: DoxX family membrane protein [Bacteroidetes bacterium]|nr:DoxX family membrane protein [Bacteroidota bacterium]